MSTLIQGWDPKRYRTNAAFVPELGKRARLRTDLLHVASFVAGMLLLLGLRTLIAH